MRAGAILLLFTWISYCDAQLPSGDATAVWFSKLLNGCPTRINIQPGMLKEKLSLWVFIEVPKASTVIKRDEITVRAFDTAGKEMSVKPPLSEIVGPDMGRGRSEIWGLTLKPDEKLSVVKIAWGGKEVVFRWEEAKILMR
jgi:hypothetical protein